MLRGLKKLNAHASRESSFKTIDSRVGYFENHRDKERMMQICGP